jgi:hypothetical protein
MRADVPLDGSLSLQRFGPLPTLHISRTVAVSGLAGVETIQVHPQR